MSDKIDTINDEKNQDFNNSDFIIGLSLAVSSSIFIGASFIIKKLALIRLRSNSTLRPSAGGYGYLKDWMWWTGFLSMGIGEAANFVAYAFAPASLVTPLGALSILVSELLAIKYLKEHLNKNKKVGCALCMVGSILIVFFAPKEVDIQTLDTIYEHVLEKHFLIYVTFIVISSFFVCVFVAPKRGTKNVIVYIYICSAIGSLSVMCCKAIGLFARELLSGDFTNMKLGVFTTLFLVFCVVVQINYLNKALDVFGASVVTPVYYVMFTTLVLLASSILLKEWQNMYFDNIIGTSCGLFIVINAIYLLQGKVSTKDSRLSKSRTDVNASSELLPKTV